MRRWLLHRIRLNNLTTKIALTIIFTSVSVVIAVAALSYQREQTSYRRALQEQAEALLSVLTSTADNALFQLDVDTIKLLTEGTVAAEGVKAVRFYDRDGHVLADSDVLTTLTFSTAVDEVGTQLLGSDSILVEWDDDYIFVGQRVQLGNQTFGAIGIELSTEILQQNIETARSQAIILGLIVTVISVILALVLSRSIINPLIRLIHASELVAQGKYEQKVEVKSNDELATLATAFNTMTDSVQRTTLELREARDNAIASQQLAQENSRLKSEFLSTMSHELRTPLNAIEGFTSIMLSGMGVELNPKAEDMVGRISANSKRLLNLINDFLDLSRIESGRLELVNDPVSPEELAQKWKRSVGVLAEGKGVDFVVNIDDKLPDTIYSDEDALTKIVINLLGNAFKFTHKGSVSLNLNCDDDDWSIVVKDSGIGIPPHAREYIFDEFRQVDGSSKRQYGGTGLGLSLVQKLSRALGGTVAIESEVGVGSTFIIKLPLIVQSEPEIQGVEA